MEIILSDGCGLFLQDDLPSHRAKMAQGWFEELIEEFEVLTAPSDFPGARNPSIPSGSGGESTLWSALTFLGGIDTFPHNVTPE